MRFPTVLAAAAALALMQGTASAQTLDQADTELATAQNLTDICSANGTDLGSQKARVFCHGFISGAMHFHRAIASELDPIACPDRTVTRREMADAYIGWSDGRTDLASMTALEGLVRAAIAEWPCPE